MDGTRKIRDKEIFGQLKGRPRNKKQEPDHHETGRGERGEGREKGDGKTNTGRKESEP
jgi:hypothetical protein